MCSTMFATTVTIYTLARVDQGGRGARYVVYCNGRLLESDELHALRALSLAIFMLCTGGFCTFHQGVSSYWTE